MEVSAICQTIGPQMGPKIIGGECDCEWGLLEKANPCTTAESLADPASEDSSRPTVVVNCGFQSLAR
jgi:hypothetical protein